MNKVILMGRLTKDPDMRYTQGENSTAVARFSLAVDRRRAADGSQNTDFPNCISFGKTAEFAGKYLAKGTKVVLTGRIQTGSYTNRDGAKVYTTDVVAEELEYAESKAAASQGQGPAGMTPQPPQTGYNAAPQTGYSQPPAQSGYNNNYNQHGYAAPPQARQTEYRQYSAPVSPTVPKPPQAEYSTTPQPQQGQWADYTASQGSMPEGFMPSVPGSVDDSGLPWN